jgi:hypothetical protein
MFLLFSWQEKPKCRYCGETLDRFSRRCSHCGSLQPRYKPAAKKNKPVVLREDIEGDGFILLGDSTGTRKNRRDKVTPIGNGEKVLLSIICAILPGVGQIAGVIASLIFMYSEHADSRSFGRALFAASVVMFVLSCIFIYFLVLALTTVSI